MNKIENKVDVSIIIPVFNAERYVYRCLESILNKNSNNIEIILIDDGSLDNSYNICKKYKLIDKRIICISQKHSGAASIRNMGINYARGEYIAFIDIDDIVSEKYIQILYDTAFKTKADIAYCTIIRLSEKHQIIGKSSYFGVEQISLLDKFKLLSDDFFPASYAKIYHKEFLKRNNIKFLVKDGYNGFAEDILFSLQANFFANKIVYCPGISYYYCSDNIKSICNDKNRIIKNNSDRLIVIQQMLLFCQERKVNVKDQWPILQAIIKHLKWGDYHLLKSFIKWIKIADISPQIKELLFENAIEYKKTYPLKKQFKEYIKRIIY